MDFSMSRRPGERASPKSVPRRKPAPVGTTIATATTLKGSLDSVEDVKQTAHQQFYTNILRSDGKRGLAESKPPEYRPQRHQQHGACRATETHLSTATLTGGCEESDQIRMRGKKVVQLQTNSSKSMTERITQNEPVTVNLFQESKPTEATPGKKLFREKVNQETAPQESSAEKGKRHVKESFASNSMRTILKFSPRVGGARAAAPRPTTAPVTRTDTRERLSGSSRMQNVLSWSTTPRATAYRGHMHRVAPRVVPPAPFDSSFKPLHGDTVAKAPVTTTSALHAAAPQEAKRVRGLHRVANRPMTARGLLSWN